MVNTNCLEGVRCPHCGQSEVFRVFAVVDCEVTDEGVADTGSAHWDEESRMYCPMCQKDGLMKDFRHE